MPSPCSLCKAECCNNLLITVTSFDLIRISEHTGLKPSQFALLASPSVLNLDQDTVLECYTSVKDRRGKRSPKLRHDFLLALKSRPCVFLSNNRCLIHAAAPMTCRNYPFGQVASPPLARLFWHRRITKNALCPMPSKALFTLLGSRVSSKEFSRELNRYKHLVREWNQKHGNKRNCIQFLMRESGKFLASK